MKFIEVNVISDSACPTMPPHRAIIGTSHVVKIAENPTKNTEALITLSSSVPDPNEPWFEWQEDLSGPPQRELAVVEDFFCVRWLLTFANGEKILSFQDYERSFSPALQRSIRRLTPFNVSKTKRLRKSSQDEQQ